MTGVGTTASLSTNSSATSLRRPGGRVRDEQAGPALYRFGGVVGVKYLLAIQLFVSGVVSLTK